MAMENVTLYGKPSVVFETDNGMAFIAVYTDGSIFVGVDDCYYDFELDAEKSLALARAILAAHEAKGG